MLLREVEDAIAAAEFLATRADVDPARIYLGGHSTGGTLAVLVAESTDRFRGVIALGPIDELRSYGDASCVPEDAPEAEALVRTPIEFVDQIRTPTFIIEGTRMGNEAAASRFYERRGSAPVTVIHVQSADHFTVIAPATEVAAQAILADTGATCTLDITRRAIEARL